MSKLEESLTMATQQRTRCDHDKTELMIFSPNRYRGPKITDTAYSDPTLIDTTSSHHHSTKIPRFFLTPTLDWRPHVSIMAMRARSTIRGLSILGNSIRGLDLVHWKQVYLMYVIPILTYGVPVWFTGQRQKGLVNTLQICPKRRHPQNHRRLPNDPNNRLRKYDRYSTDQISSSTHTTFFRNRMIATNPHHLLHTLSKQMINAPTGVTHPPTNLTSLFHNLGPYVQPHDHNPGPTITYSSLPT
jgi:hypothetical protein